MMYLQENKKPKWKLKKDRLKTHSFDSSLAELGINGEFLNAKKVNHKLETATSTNLCGIDPCSAK